MKTKILIVEDELYTGEALASWLEQLGYEPLDVITSGEETLDKIDDLSPDLILMDIVIEGDLNGIETAVKIRKKYDIPVIFLTAYSEDGTIKKAKKAEPYGYIVKPVTSENDLRPTIEIALYKHRTDRERLEKERKLDQIERIVTSPEIDTDDDTHTFKDEITLEEADLSEILADSELPDWFQALNNEERCRVLVMCLDGAKKFGDIKIALDKSKSTVSHHLKILDENAMIRAIRKGKYTTYRLNALPHLRIFLENGDIMKEGEIISALANEERLLIMSNLAEGNADSKELKKHIGKEQATVSHHLRDLQKQDLVYGERDGRNVLYHLNTDKLFEYTDLFIAFLEKKSL